MIWQRIPITGASITKDISTIAAMMLAQANGKLIVATLTMSDVIVGHP